MSPQQHMDLPALRTIPFFALEWTRPPTCVSMLAQKWTGPHEQGAVSVISAFITPSLFQSRLKTYFYNILPTIVDFWYSLGCLHGSLNWAGLITLIGLVLVHFTGPGYSRRAGTVFGRDKCGSVCLWFVRPAKWSNLLHVKCTFRGGCVCCVAHYGFSCLWNFLFNFIYSRRALSLLSFSF